MALVKSWHLKNEFITLKSVITPLPCQMRIIQNVEKHRTPQKTNTHSYAITVPLGGGCRSGWLVRNYIARQYVRITKW